MQELDYFFRPKNVVLVGASETEGSVGKTITQNLLKFKDSRPCFLVNPKRDEIFGHKTHKDIPSLPSDIDLAIVATPAKTVLKVVEELGQKNVKACVIISAGFKELGHEGEELEKSVILKARHYGMRVIGPNCLGIMNPLCNLNATFAASMAQKGRLAFISQSGAMCTAVLDYSDKNDIGFSGFISIGSMADVEFHDLMTYFGNDKDTSGILLYMETVGDTKKFLKAARETSLKKPIIILKAGKTQEAAKAAASHTGSLAGSDAIFDAAIEEVGVLRARNISDLFNYAQVLDYQPLPEGNKVTLLTNAGGPGVLATDALVLSGGKLAPLSHEAIESLNMVLPHAWSHSNPVDLLGDAGAKRYEDALKVVAVQKDTDGMIVVLSPQDMTDPLGTAKGIIDCKKITNKPIYASFMGAEFVEKGVKLLKDHKIPNFSYPDMACETFSMLASNRLWARQLKDKQHKEFLSAEDIKGIKTYLAKIKADNRLLLTEIEAKELLELAKIPATPMKIAKTDAEAVSLAKAMGYPIVLKLHSHTITHKSDVGGVKLNLKNEQDIIKAFNEIKNNVKKEDFDGVTVQPMILQKGFELILGSSTDPQFGPVMLAGLGGELVEVFKDTALALPILSVEEAEHLIKKTKIYTALCGYRGKPPVMLERLYETIAKFSELIYKVEEIEESDINPLCVSSNQLIALDARFVIKKD
jgi:acetyltransferase